MGGSGIQGCWDLVRRECAAANLQMKTPPAQCTPILTAMLQITQKLFLTLGSYQKGSHSGTSLSVFDFLDGTRWEELHQGRSLWSPWRKAGLKCGRIVTADSSALTQELLNRQTSAQGSISTGHIGNLIGEKELVLALTSSYALESKIRTKIKR